ncbi:MAG: sulfatase [Deltaproteobacteria bacterium]|nr:sulfatase [Deltaproteobacteria bacterium]
MTPNETPIRGHTQADSGQPPGTSPAGTSSAAESTLNEGLLRGLAFGLCFAVAEAILNVPTALRMHLQAPPHAILKSLAFDLVAGALLGLALSPLLGRKRGGPLHTLLCVTALAAIVLWLSPRFMTAMVMAGVMLALTLALYAAGLWMRRRRTLAKLRLPIAIVLVVAAYGVPRALTPTPPAPPAAKASAPAGAPNVLLIVIDTVRADHLDAYGYSRQTAPTLARLAGEGAFFERAIAPGTWTIPTHASMFTGLYPSAHGAHHEGNLLALENTTLAEVLHENGYRTVGFNSNPFMTDSNGFTQGFERMEPSWLMMTAPMQFLAYRIATRAGLLFEDHGAREVTARFTKWVGEEWDGEKPFFVFLNYIESHFPYQVLPPDYRDRFVPEGTSEDAMREASDAAIGGQLFGDKVAEDQIALVRDLYDGGIVYEDGLIARVIEALKARGVLDNTAVILVSDHGELFGEHGLYGHEMSLSEQLIHVPLVVRYPGRVPAGLRIAAPVTTVSVFATALDLAGVPEPERVHARSLGPIFDVARKTAGGVGLRSGPAGDTTTGAAAPAGGMRVMTTPPSSRSPIFSEQHRFEGIIPGTYKPQGPFDQMEVRYRALEEDGWKLIVDEKGNRWLFRPALDPGEETNLADKHPDVVARLARSQEQIVKGLGLGAIDAEKLGPGGDVELDPAAHDALKALGYVQ